MQDPELPYSEEAERMVIGQILMYDYCIKETAALLRLDDFYFETNRIIYKAALDLNSEGTPTEIHLVGRRILDRNLQEKIGGLESLSKYLDDVCTGQTLEHYAKIIKEKAAVRNLVHVATDITTEAPRQTDADEFLAESRKSMLDATIVHTAQNPTVGIDADVGKLVGEVLDGEAPSEIIPTGLKSIDDRCGGLCSSLLTVIAGRPGMGKSAFLLNLAIEAGLRGRKVLYFSLEDARIYQQRRMLSRLADINLKSIMLNKTNEAESKRLLQTQVTLSNRSDPLFWINDSVKTSNQLAQAAMLQKTTLGLDLLLVDHLGYLRDEGKDEYQIASAAVRNLATLAKDLKIPLVLAVQLNRKVEERKSKIPELADLRASGRIEEDARAVWLLYRPAAYDSEHAEQNRLDLRIAKSTHGRVGKIELYCDMAKMFIRDKRKEDGGGKSQPPTPQQDIGYN
jgi:replicative DNA helicase